MPSALRTAFFGILLATVVLLHASAAPRVGSQANRLDRVALTGTVSGIAVDAITGHPLPGVDIMLNGPNTVFTRTAPDGSFAFHNLGPFEYSLDGVGERGSPPHRRASRRLLLTLGPGEQRTGLDLRLHQLTTVRGTVIDPNGLPVPDYDVIPFALENRRAMATSEGRTDDLGRFEIGGLLPGEYVVGAGPRLRPERVRAQMAHPAGTERYALTYYPHADSAARAEVVRLGASSDSEITITLRRVPVGTLTGRVVLEGASGEGLQLLLRRYDPDVVMTSSQASVDAVRAGPDGLFTFRGVAPGEYVVSVNSGPAGDRLSLRVTAPQRDGERLLLSVPARVAPNRASQPTPPANALGNARLEGVVHDASSRRPLSDVLVTLKNTVTDAEHWADSDADGRFLFANLPAGPYDISVEKMTFVPASDGSGGHRISVTDGAQQTLDLEFVRGGVITGTLFDEDGQPLAGAGVRVRRVERRTINLIVSDLGRWDSPPTTAGPTDAAGRFRLFGLPAGDYVVFTQDAGITTFHRATVDVASASWVRVAPGTTSADIDIHRRPARFLTVSGTIVDDNGPARANFSLEMIRMNVQTPDVISGTEVAGAFTFGSLTPGTYVVVIRTQSAVLEPRYAMADVTVKDEDVRDLQLRLQPTATFSGRVVVDGRPVHEPPMRVNLAPLDMPFERASFARNTKYVEKDGSFAVRGVIPGRYRVSVVPNSSAPLPWRLETVTLADGRVLAEHVVDLPRAELYDQAVITLAPRR